MALEELNQYKGSFADSSVQEVVAESIEVAANLLTDVITGTEPRIIQCLKTGIRVMVPSNNVNFIVTVSPIEAGAGGCVATPQAYSVLDGTTVILSAIPAAGWTFDRWTLNGVDLDDGEVPPVLLPAVTEVEITAGVPSSITVEYVAVFEPIP